jgi:hypothetical protein
VRRAAAARAGYGRAGRRVVRVWLERTLARHRGFDLEGLAPATASDRRLFLVNRQQQLNGPRRHLSGLQRQSMTFVYR